MGRVSRATLAVTLKTWRFVAPDGCRRTTNRPASDSRDPGFSGVFAIHVTSHEEVLADVLMVF